MFSRLGLKKNGLRIIIVGCGKVGMTLVEQLSKEGHDVTIIDSNPQKVSSVANFNDVLEFAVTVPATRHRWKPAFRMQIFLLR